jgi:hypothetical protein
LEKDFWIKHGKVAAREAIKRRRVSVNNGIKKVFKGK